MAKKKENIVSDALLAQMKSLERTSPYILRVTERKGLPIPVLEICDRIENTDQKSISGRPVTRLRELGTIQGANLRACQQPIWYMLSHMQDNEGRPYDAANLLRGEIAFRGRIPLDEEAGTKLSLLIRLQGQVRDAARVELMAWRIERFSQEEAMYWLARTMVGGYGQRSMEWNKSGLRIMLAGQQKDTEAVDDLLARLRK